MISRLLRTILLLSLLRSTHTLPGIHASWAPHCQSKQAILMCDLTPKVHWGGHGVETPTPVDTIAKTWSSARQSTIARLQSRPCDSGGPATNRPAPPAHGTTCRPSRRCSRAAVLAGDQRGQRLTGSSTAGCRCEMNHSAHPVALSNHLPHALDCPGSIKVNATSNPVVLFM